MGEERSCTTYYHFSRLKRGILYPPTCFHAKRQPVSHTGTSHTRTDAAVVTTHQKPGVLPDTRWPSGVLDNVGAFGVKRLTPACVWHNRCAR